MPTVIMPKMGDAMEEGTLLRWLKQAGEEVAVGEALAEIETDKVTLEIEAAEGGVLTRTLVQEGQTVPIGTAIATIGEDAVAVAAAPASAAVQTNGRAADAPVAARPAPIAAAPVRVAPEPPSPPAAVPTGNGATLARGAGERLRASPLVKRLAAEHGIDLSSVVGTGPGGRIVKDDIAPLLVGAPVVPAVAPAVAQPVVAAPAPALLPAAPSGRPAGVARELSRIRRTTGKRMAESKQSAPHFYITIDVDMAAAVAFREEVNGQVTDDASKLTFNDLIVKAAALALREFPNLNASLEGDQLFDHANIDVNVAVAIEGGLIAPFIPDADQKSLGTIARMAKDLIGRARNGGLKPEEFQGGTFTISNLGMYDVAEFIAVINPPQAAILAVSSILETPVIANGEVVVGRRMKLTLSADHRVTDGAEGARFLQAVKRYLQNPMLLALS